MNERFLPSMTCKSNFCPAPKSVDWIFMFARRLEKDEQKKTFFFIIPNHKIKNPN